MKKKEKPIRRRPRVRRARPLLAAAAGAVLLTLAAGCGDNSCGALGTCPDYGTAVGDMSMPVRGD